MCIDFQRRTGEAKESEQESEQPGQTGNESEFMMTDTEYSTGDTAKFRLKSGEIHKGDVVFIERSQRGDMVYINSSNRTAYRVPGKRIISSVP